MNTITPSLTYSLAAVLGGREPAAFDIGPDGHVWFLLPLAAAPDAADAPPKDTRFRVVELAQGRVLFDLTIDCPGVDQDLSSVNPLGDQVLVAWSSDGNPNGTWEANAWVYSRDGVQQRVLNLGEGIDQLQVAGDDVIWTSHLDQGYYSRWEGCASLVSWDGRGGVAFRLPDIEGLYWDTDIQALNLASVRDCWFICAGALWHLRDRRPEGAWALAGLGSGAFAVAGQDVLLAGAWERYSMPQLVDSVMQPGVHGASDMSRLQAEDALAAMMKLYGMGVQWNDERDEASRGFSLCWLRLHSGGATTIEGDFALRTPDGQEIEPTAVRGRGSRLFVLAGETLHEVALADVVGG